jgi:hypothetical protein
MMFIPWGEWSLIKSRLSEKRWQFLGCISPEDRCRAAPAGVRVDVDRATLVKIWDESPLDFTEEKDRLAHQEAILVRELEDPLIVEKPLLANLDDLMDVVETLADGPKNLLFDITSYPKRWFFGILRFVLEEGRFDNVIVTYAPAQSYDNVLASNPETIRALPGFSCLDARSDCDVAFVGVGFHSHSILDLFDLERPRRLSMLLPFPPGPPGLVRNWRFVERFETSVRAREEGKAVDAALSESRISALDAPQCFAALVSGSDSGRKSSLVAPFGPKPMSLAMALFSLWVEREKMGEVPAYYSQPLRYSLNYSRGISKYRGKDRLISYPVKINGRILYGAC